MMLKLMMLKLSKQLTNSIRRAVVRIMELFILDHHVERLKQLVWLGFFFFFIVIH